MSSPVQISVVVPVFDEEPSLAILHQEITRALEATGETFELIFVDDRSRDGSLAVMLELWRRDERVRVIQFRARSGQTAALAAGFEHARGEVVVTLDGDLQNDPADIPRLVAELRRGHDIVAGWRRSRRDGFVLRRLPSLAANRLIALVTGVRIHDTGCTLKAFRRELVQKLPIYAEQHRFLPAMSAGSGARVTEVEVHHRPRRFGASKYGISRATRVLLDLLSVKMIASFSRSPLQYFGLLALPFAALVVFFLAKLLSELVGSGPISLDNQWGSMVVLVFMMFFMLCVYFLLLGLLAELAVKASGMHRERVLATTPGSIDR